MKQRRPYRRFGLLVMFVFLIFISCLINSGIAMLVVYFLVHNRILILSNTVAPDVELLILSVAILALVVGLIVALMVSKFPMKPIRNLIIGMDRLASGDFKTRVNAGSIMRNYPPFVEAVDSFNKMAEELERTEMLRSDFINNFSHEVKTPIVSIAGFARLLKRGSLGREQELEYLNAIEEESMRLSYMATNVLNLTKVENQRILTNVTRFNLSEQLRNSILLLEREWERKQLDLQLDFREHMICANEELLKQVWINLLHNAVKFAPEGHSVSVRIREDPESLSVSILNTGSTISKDQQDKIFHKFYQADESHSSEGNGVGLAIVKRIVDLHQGRVSVSSGPCHTEFIVNLPQNGSV